MPAPADAYYYLSPDQKPKPLGPYDAATLLALRARGAIGSATLVSRPGAPQWRPFSAWPELQGGLSAEPLGASAPPPPPAEGVYRVKRWLRWFVTAFFGLFAAGSLWLLVFPFTGQKGAPPLSAIFFLLFFGLCGAVGFTLGIVESWVAAVVVGPDRLVKKGLLGTRTLPFEAISGVRLLVVKSSKYLLFVPKDPKGKTIKISESFEDWPRLFAWGGQSFGNLDAIEAAEVTREILADESLGGTPESRARRLALARKWNRAAVGLAAALMFWGAFWPHPYLLVVILLGLAAFLLPAVFFIAFRGYVAFDGKKSDPRPKLFALALLPLLGLFLRAVIDVHFLSPWWAVAVPCAVAGFLMAALLRPLLAERKWATALLVMGPFGSVLAYGLLAESDVVLDRTPARRAATSISEMRVETGSKGGRRYMVKVAGWPGHPDGETFRVSRPFFDRVHPHEPISVIVRGGAWGLAWGYLQLAPAPPPNVPMVIPALPVKRS